MTQLNAVSISPTPEPVQIDPVQAAIADLSTQATSAAQSITDEATAKQAQFQTDYQDYLAALEIATKAGTPLPTPPTPPTLDQFVSVQTILKNFGPQRKAIDAFTLQYQQLFATIQRQCIDTWEQQMAAGETPQLMSLSDACKKYMP